jgi:AcrR family transcriptional regulator
VLSPGGGDRVDPLTAAYEDGARQVAGAVQRAVANEAARTDALAAGLRAGLECLAGDPALARLLLVEAPIGDTSLRDLHERALGRLADALREATGRGAAPSREPWLLLAAGLVSHLAGQVVAGETARLAEEQRPLLTYVLAFDPA